MLNQKPKTLSLSISEFLWSTVYDVTFSFFLQKPNNVNHLLSLSTFPPQGCVPQPIQQKYIFDRLPVHHRANRQTDKHSHLHLFKVSGSPHQIMWRNHRLYKIWTLQLWCHRHYFGSPASAASQLIPVKMGAYGDWLLLQPASSGRLNFSSFALLHWLHFTSTEVAIWKKSVPFRGKSSNHGHGDSTATLP